GPRRPAPAAGGVADGAAQHSRRAVRRRGEWGHPGAAVMDCTKPVVVAAHVYGPPVLRPVSVPHRDPQRVPAPSALPGERDGSWACRDGRVDPGDAASYRWLEKPFLRLRDRIASRSVPTLVERNPAPGIRGPDP